MKNHLIWSLVIALGFAALTSCSSELAEVTTGGVSDAQGGAEVAVAEDSAPVFQVTDHAIEAVLDSHRWIPESWTGQGDPGIPGGVFRFSRIDAQAALLLDSWCSFTVWSIEYTEIGFVVGPVIPPDPEADSAPTGSCDDEESRVSLDNLQIAPGQEIAFDLLGVNGDERDVVELTETEGAWNATLLGPEIPSPPVPVQESTTTTTVESES